MTITLRNARSGDARQIFSWRNHPEIVARGEKTQVVSWDEHVRWFEGVLRNPRDHLLLVIADEGADIGVVRFDRAAENEAIISIYLAPGWSGHGLGVEAIRFGCQQAIAAWDVDAVRAEVRKDNPAAIAAFTKAGFAPAVCATGSTPSDDRPVRHFKFRRTEL